MKRTHLFAALLLVTALALGWCWKTFGPVRRGAVEITFLASERSVVRVVLNGREFPAEQVEAEVGSSTMEQTLHLEVASPKVKTLVVTLTDAKGPAGKLILVRLLSAGGRAKWEGLPPAEGQEWKKAQSLSPGRSASPTSQAGKVTLVSVTVFLCFTLAAGAARRLRRLPLGRLSFVGVAATSLGLAGLLYFGCLLAQRGAPLVSESWAHDVALEKVALVAHFPSPRLLLVGGSSGLYGVSCEQLSAGGRMPAVNLATHGSFPISYHLDKCRPLLHRGDTVLFHLEYGYYFSRAKPSNWELDQAMTWAAKEPRSECFANIAPWTLLTSVPPQRVLAGLLATTFPDAFHQPTPTLVEVPSLGRQWHFGAYRAGLNAHGDLLPGGLPRGGAPYAKDYLSRVFDPQNHNLVKLSAFISEARDQGVGVYFSFPATIRSELADFSSPRNRTWIDAFTDWATRQGAQVLGRPEETQLPIECFLDTPYHLVPEARARHTATLLRLLEKEMGAAPKARLQD